MGEIEIESNKSEDQKNSIKNVENIFGVREKIIELFKEYSFLLSETKYKAKHGKALKILTPKQMLQILPTALAQV